MTGTVYICSKGRPGSMSKILPRWKNANIHAVVVVEPIEHGWYLKNTEGWSSASELVQLPANNKGIGFARQFALEHAQVNGHKSIIMADDDVMPKKGENGSNMHWLLYNASLPNRVGVGATHSYHNWLTQGKMEEIRLMKSAFVDQEAILCPGGWAFQCYGLNVSKALELGGFPPELNVFGEDAELMRRGLRAGIPWYVHPQVQIDRLGARFAPGGISSLTDNTEPTRWNMKMFDWYPGDELFATRRKLHEIICQHWINDWWPEFTSAPPKPPRCAWKKMYNKYLPDWEDWSALHDGVMAGNDYGEGR